MQRIAGLLLTLAIAAHAGAQGVEVKLEPLSEEQQAKLLARRTQGGMVGTFGNFGSMLYAINNVVVHSDNERVVSTRLHSPFPDWYKPTWAEFFDTMARQTSSSWSYDEDRAFWLFAEPAAALPYEVQLPEGSEAEGRGIGTHYTTEGKLLAAIYVLGHYSADEDEEELFVRVRDDVALRSASRFGGEAEVDAMERIVVADSEALFYETVNPHDGSNWRQWVFVSGGHAISILSSLNEEDEPRLLPDLRALIASIKVESDEEDRASE